MSHALVAVTVFFVTAGLSTVFVGRTRTLSRQLAILDPVGGRRIHAVPVPRTGGSAMFLAFCVGVTLTFCFDVHRFAPETERLLLLISAGALIVGVMLYDDLAGISPLPKLLWQIAAAAMVIVPRFRGPSHGIVVRDFNAPFLGEVRLPLIVAVSVTVFWIVGMMNTINWVDGLDGLAASITIVACCILFLHTYFWPRHNPQFTISLLPLVLAAAVVGFLPFNWHPASIIMGDAGSNFLGFALAVASIIGGAKFATALLALGLPILDVGWVIVYRATHGRSPMTADRGHLHHRLLDAGWTQAKIVAFLSGLSLVFGISSLLLPTRGLKLGAIIALAAILAALLFRFAVNDAENVEHTELDDAALLEQ